MKILSSITFVFFIVSSFNLKAQNFIILNKFPSDYQLFPRGGDNNGTYTIDGSVTEGGVFTGIKVKLYRENQLVKEIRYSLSYVNGKAPFSIPIQIKAELSNYKVELYFEKTGQADTFYKKAEKLVAGDVFIVNGQSNCIGSIEDGDYDTFMRSYTTKFGWNDIKYTQPSKWAPRVAKNIIEKHKIPIALFNEAMGGVTQTYFLKNKNNIYSSNYGTLYKRLEEAEVLKGIKAILWWQGESDGWETPGDVFKKQFKELYNAWMTDYNNPQVYYFQIRFRSCTHINPAIMEMQRQLSSEIKDIKIMSANAAQSDSCHFTYNNGYDSLGNRLYRLMAGNIYNQSTTNTAPPDIDKAWFSASNEITIRLKNMIGNLKVIGKPWSDFETTGRKVGIVDGSVTGNFIKLKLGGDSTGVKGISYLSHITPYNDWIVNPLGVGILSFYDVPILSNFKLENTNNQTDSPIDIYPTISNQTIFIKRNTAPTGLVEAHIYNTLGIKIMDKTFRQDEDNAAINISQLPRGHYIIVFTEGGKKNIVKRFLKI